MFIFFYDFVKDIKSSYIIRGLITVMRYTSSDNEAIQKRRLMIMINHRLPKADFQKHVI